MILRVHIWAVIALSDSKVDFFDTVAIRKHEWSFFQPPDSHCCKSQTISLSFGEGLYCLISARGDGWLFRASLSVETLVTVKTTWRLITAASWRNQSQTKKTKKKKKHTKKRLNTCLVQHERGKSAIMTYFCVSTQTEISAGADDSLFFFFFCAEINCYNPQLLVFSHSYCVSSAGLFLDQRPNTHTHTYTHIHTLWH